MPRINRISIRMLLIAMLIFAVGLGVLRIPDSRSTHFMALLQARKIDGALAMIRPPLSDEDLGFFKDFLRRDDVSVCTETLDFSSFFCCERTVCVSNQYTNYVFSVGLLSVRLKYVIEALVHPGDFDEF